MNLNALREIIENHEHLLVERAQSMGLEEQSVRAAALIVDDRGYDALVGRQIWVFDNAVRPLIEDVSCDGYQGLFGEDQNECPNILEDDDLVECYQNESLLCEACQGNANSDSAARDSFMRE